METLPVAVAVLAEGRRTPDQRAALAWCERVAAAVEPVTFDDIAVGRCDLSTFDVCFWHRDHPLDAPSREAAAAVADPLHSFLSAGGGLVLSSRALAGVEALGVDDVPPDATGEEAPPADAGFAVKRLHRDHPAFEALDERVPAGDRGERPFARYESVLPANGEVLACEFREADLLVERKSVVAWRVGDGGAIGIGSGVRFDAPGEDRTPDGDAEAKVGAGVSAAVDRLCRNALAAAGDDRSPRVDGRPRDADGLCALRERLADDHLRPSYHLTPPANWLNDPNGLIEWDGRYHAFYQYNPGGPFHGTIHWGHAVSDDLVRWSDEPVALTPSPDGPDRDGCWSGCAVDDAGTPTALYTGGRGRHQLPCLATADDDDLRTWTKDPHNPVIGAPPAGLDVIESDHWNAEFRDHCVWRRDAANADAGAGSPSADRDADGDAASDGGADADPGEWLHLVGSGVADEGGVALLYRGASLDEWEYVGPLLAAADADPAGEGGSGGGMWECPELLELDGGDLLHVSDYESVRYYLGRADYDDPAFAVERTGLLDHGEFYAPQSMRVGGSEYRTFGWLPEARDVDAQWEAGWSGALSLPRDLSVGADGDLRQRPAPELTDLRGERLAGDADAGRLAAGDRRALDAEGNAYELRARVALDPDAEADADDPDPEASATAFELGVCESPAGSERTAIRFDGESLIVDRSESSHHPGVDRSPVEMDLSTTDGETAGGTGRLDLRAFVDGSVIELFVEGRACLTARVYPTRADATGVSVTAVDGAVALESFDLWRMESAWA